MKRIVIWGVGAMAEAIDKCFDSTASEIICYVDSDPIKQGENFKGKRIIAPQTLPYEGFDFVFVSSVIYQDQILRQLEELEIEREKIIPAIMKQGDMAKIFDIVTEKGFLYFTNITNNVRINQLNSKVNRLAKRTDNRSIHLYLKEYYEKSAAQFMVENILEGENAPGKEVLFEDRWLYFDYVLKELKHKDGLYLEFGVFRGVSINYISERIGQNIIYGFDCFEGLPEKWIPSSQIGSMDERGQLPKVNDNVELVKGLFEDTLPDFVQKHKGEKCSLIHIDCDLYSSTKTVFSLLKDNIGSGTMICFDEFVGHIGWQEDEYKAFMEFIEETGHKYRYVACSWAQTAYRSGERMAIEIL